MRLPSKKPLCSCLENLQAASLLSRLRQVPPAAHTTMEFWTKTPLWLENPGEAIFLAIPWHIIRGRHYQPGWSVSAWLKALVAVRVADQHMRSGQTTASGATIC